MLSMQDLLSEYIQLWDAERGGGISHTREKWDERAEDWGRKEKENPVTLRRIDEAVSFLSQHNLLGADCDILDVGSGPCCFTAAFAKTAHHVTAADLSPKMLAFGEEYCREQGCRNTSFVPCDFKDVSIREMGWENRFDLVFSSMTPAIGKFEAIEKMIAASRGFCCNATCIIAGGKMQEEIGQILEEDLIHRIWDGRGFHILNSIVWLLGYFPETSYYKIQYPSDREITPENVEDELHLLCRGDMPDQDAVNKVYETLLAHSDRGIYRDERWEWHGFILWDTRIKTSRW